jgi:hypothetical protein
MYDIKHPISPAQFAAMCKLTNLEELCISGTWNDAEVCSAKTPSFCVTSNMCIDSELSESVLTAVSLGLGPGNPSSFFYDAN